jgi:transcriptional regulator with XRE-family HTH domain
MAQINDRILEIRTALKLSQREFSRRIHISQSLYCDMEIGHVEFKERYLALISSQFNVNLDWIKTGKGDKFSSPPPDARLDYLIEIFKQLDPELQDCVLDHLRGLLKVQKGKKAEDDSSRIKKK